MKVLIIENEKPAAQRLIRLLKNSGQDIEIVHWLESVETSTNWLMANPCPDLIFMDIQLDDGLCFEIFENIEVKAPVIFTTAFDEYALRAFKVNSVDYILKPVDQEALNKALDKYRNFHAGGMGSSQREALLDQWKPKTKERFLIKIECQDQKINYPGKMVNVTLSERKPDQASLVFGALHQIKQDRQ